VGTYAVQIAKALGAHVSGVCSTQKPGTFVNKENHEDLMVLKELIESGKVTPVIDRTYPLEDAPEAIRYLEGGHARGKVVITV
jgi:NADPH:quinone reductase-like Zn-dependent oxidoreductase